MFLFQGCSSAKLWPANILAVVVVNLVIACLIISAVRSPGSCRNISVRIEIVGLIFCLVSHGMMIYDNAMTTCVEDKDDEISLWIWAIAHIIQSTGYFFLVQGEIRECRQSRKQCEKAGIWLLLSGSVLEHAIPVHVGTRQISFRTLMDSEHVKTLSSLVEVVAMVLLRGARGPSPSSITELTAYVLLIYSSAFGAIWDQHSVVVIVAELCEIIGLGCFMTVVYMERFDWTRNAMLCWPFLNGMGLAFIFSMTYLICCELLEETFGFSSMDFVPD